MEVSSSERKILEKLPKKIRLNFVDLYKTEIIDRFSLDQDHWHFFDGILDFSEIESYIEKKKENPETAAAKFYDALFNSTRNEVLYSKLLDYFKEVDNELYSIFSVDEWGRESSHLFVKFLNSMDTLIPHLDLQKVVDYLSKYSFALRREYNPVLERWKSGEISEYYARSLITRTICIMNDSSTYHLMYAILKCSDEARQAVENIFPEFEMFYIRNIFEDRDGIFHVVDQFDNLKDAINRIMDPDIESPYAVNVLFDYIPRYHIAPLFNRVTKSCNTANSEEHSPEDNDFIPLKNFTLIILDEANHTGKSHPFNELMDIFRHEKYGEENTQVQKLPQVVSMTASLGTSKTEDIEGIKKHIIDICANMDSEVISRTVKNLDELREFTSETEEEIISVPKNEEELKTFRNHLMDLVHYIEKELKEIPEISERYEELFSNYCDISLMSYINWISNCSENILPKFNLPSISMKNARFFFRVLEVVFWTLKCSVIFPTKNAVEFYLRGLGNLDGDVHERRVYETVDTVWKMEEKKPLIFKKLIEIIEDQFEKDPESRVMIFMGQKVYCKMAVECIAASTKKEVSYITGVNSARNDFGQNIIEQEKALEDFKSGKTKILCGTTVADEGLDIVECNLIIKYDLVTDEIAHVQRKGRARRKKSRCLFLTSNPSNEEKEKLNKKLIEKMTIALDDFSKMSEQEVSSMIKRRIREVNAKRIEKWEKKKILKEKLAPQNDAYHILCKDCGTCVTNSEFIKSLCGNFVVADPDIWKKVNVRELSEKEKDYFERKVGILGNVSLNIALQHESVDYVGLAKTIAANVKEKVESDPEEEEISNFEDFEELTAELYSGSDSDSTLEGNEEEDYFNDESEAIDKVERLTPEGRKMVENEVEKKSENVEKEKFKDSTAFWEHIDGLFKDWKSGKMEYETYYEELVENFTWAEKWISDFDPISYRRKVEEVISKEKPLFPSKKFLDSFYKTYNYEKTIKHELVNPRLLPQIDRLSPKKRGTIKDYVVVKGDIVGVKSRRTCLPTFAQIENIYVDENTKQYASLIWLRRKTEDDDTRVQDRGKMLSFDDTSFDPKNFERAFCDEKLHPLENLTFECHRPKLLEFQDEPTVQKLVFKQYRKVLKKNIKFLNSKRRRDLEARRPEEELTRVPRKPCKFWIEKREAFTRNKSGFLVVKQVLRAGKQTKDAIA
ncbi:hypothetical protein FO519_004904 [Halicephalobus sp. NKZ332]|nr:hypothetical protein FO519_004904 [Halicephalobus sp. NKZ332]